MIKKKIIKGKGILFWITGLSGSGKTTFAKKIHKDIINKYGPTILISGDDIRKIFNLKGYEINERLTITRAYCKLAKYITNQKVNIIFAVVGLFDEPRKWNKKNIVNYIEIYIKANISKIIKIKKKKIYQLKNSKNLVGVHIKPQLPKKPDIIISNSFKLTPDKVSNKLLKKINNLIYEKK